MRRVPDLILYLAVFVLFGSVLLWVQSADWPVIVFGGGAALVLLALAAVAGRRRPVLLVGEASERVTAIGAALQEEGYDVCSCAGPSNRPCPVLRGRPCPLDERPMAAVICHEDGQLYAPCGAEFWVPFVVVEDRLAGEPERLGNAVRVGPGESAERVVGRMREVLAA
jgi:hypothetical protein